MGKSLLWRVWTSALDVNVCLECKELHGKIYSWVDPVPQEPHPGCRCKLPGLETIAAGKATNDGMNGADFWLVHYGRLPDHYISYSDAEARGWNPGLGNLSETCPGLMVTRGRYRNKNGKLPSAPGRIWYEADINYQEGYRNRHRIVYSK